MGSKKIIWGLQKELPSLKYKQMELLDPTAGDSPSAVIANAVIPRDAFRVDRCRPSGNDQPLTVSSTPQPETSSLLSGDIASVSTILECPFIVARCWPIGNDQSWIGPSSPFCNPAANSFPSGVIASELTQCASEVVNQVLDEFINPMLEKLHQMEKAVMQERSHLHGLDMVYLAGGASNLSRVQDLAMQQFGGERVWFAGKQHAKEGVVRGLGYSLINSVSEDFCWCKPEM